MAITLQIIGHKKSGKTLITTTLIERLAKEGYRVAALNMMPIMPQWMCQLLTVLE